VEAVSAPSFEVVLASSCIAIHFIVMVDFVSEYHGAVFLNSELQHEMVIVVTWMLCGMSELNSNFLQSLTRWMAGWRQCVVESYSGTIL